MTGRVQLAACKTLANKLRERMQPFEYPSVRYWSKEINGTLHGGQKNKFFNSRAEADDAPGQPRQLKPVNPWPRGLPGVA